MKNLQKSTTKTCVTNLKPLLIIAIFVLLTCILTGCQAESEPEVNDPSTVQFTTKVTKSGSGQFGDEVTVGVAEYFACQIEYVNLTTEPQTDIVIWADIPECFQILEDSTKYYAIGYENGVEIDNDIREGIRLEQCAGYDPESGATKGETITVIFSLQALDKGQDANQYLADITGKIKTSTARCEDTATVTITEG